MDASPLNLKQLFEPDRRYLVPMFQRPYVWTAEAQWQPLWEDIRDVAERLDRSGQDVRPHFLGAIVLDHVRQSVSRVEARLIVDGQQRLTTLQLLLEAASDVCRQRGWDRYHRAFVKLTRNEDPLSEDPDEVFKVWPTNVDRDAFRRVMSADSPEGLRAELATSGHALESPIAQVYLFFATAIREWLPESDPSSGDRIAHLYAVLREKLRVVVIDLGEKDDPQLIFETLNARGTPLLPADLIKNHLFHLARRSDLSVERLHQLHWKHFDDEPAYWRGGIAAGRVKRSRIDLFLQHYLAMQSCEEVQVAHLYATFQDHLVMCGHPVDEELASLARYSRVFRCFDDCDSKSRIGIFFSRLEDLEITTAHPLLLHLFGLNPSRAELEGAVVAIESFLIRRLVCQLTTKNYNRLFLDVLKAIRHESVDVAGALRRQLLSGSGDSVRWPSDREFRDAWLEMPIYKTLARRRTRTVLEALELASRGPKTEATGLQKKLTIEHVLPQSWEAHWPVQADADFSEARAERERLLHTMGNLTLLTKVLNPAASNGPWTSKRAAIQENSVLILNKRLAECAEWNESAIRRRGAELFAHAVALWPRPELPSDSQQPTPCYSTLARRVLADAPSSNLETGRVQCPVPGCAFVFKKGVMGWDAHVGRLKRHPQWHPDVVRPSARRALFEAEFPDFPTSAREGSAGREYWSQRADARSLAVVDACEALLTSSDLGPRVYYPRQYIAFGTARKHFCWFRPQRSKPYCSVQLRSEKSSRADLCARLTAAGITIAANKWGSPRLKLRADDLARHRALLQNMFEAAFREASD